MGVRARYMAIQHQLAPLSICCSDAVVTAYMYVYTHIYTYVYYMYIYIYCCLSFVALSRLDPVRRLYIYYIYIYTYIYIYIYHMLAQQGAAHNGPMMPTNALSTIAPGSPYEPGPRGLGVARTGPWKPTRAQGEPPPRGVHNK